VNRPLEDLQLRRRAANERAGEDQLVSGLGVDGAVVGDPRAANGGPASLGLERGTRAGR
jgi:hypothetical protein